MYILYMSGLAVEADFEVYQQHSTLATTSLLPEPCGLNPLGLLLSLRMSRPRHESMRTSTPTSSG